ncbi:ABC transporter substrate-binding protein [Planktothrix agardhii]|uniref:Glutathione-binding protein GsiB n=1 Tax=Planktothrix agardhii TaxID=1160 RepID=A0AAD1PZB5_PLAAG|nr:ABC transporter substrate-binding protein [Planktothrix agardhii]MCB8749203.1 ABC transporter substrate-binding protein [Planktothrix agardhii 1810]MCB8766918.1 ABC transporter substrate-binding protein [Planktothrix agardhii 1809]MCB8779918.1 ABC transporter substrate-binding protein [Planktothrix agardhii 1031]MCB8784344.1 ABC transporter substrate-binding protein [Planktothrix agardhii 1808]MCF3564634.1 ABC transporter substrate-binding protein [Planktothrix agardhii 1807]
MVNLWNQLQNLHPFSRKFLTKWIGLFCLFCLILVSCSSQQRISSSSPSSSDNGRITIGTTLKLRTLDPADAYEVISGNILYNLGDRLYDYEIGTNQLIPKLATALPTLSSDGLTYTIPIRKGVLFHDQTPFDAAAMEFSIKRFIQNAGSPSSLLADTIDTVQATGDYELTIKLKKPFAAFPSLLAFSGITAVSPQFYEIGEGKFKPNEFVGTGPYKLKSLGIDVIRLDAFDQYWGEKPANRGVDIQRFSSSSNLFNAFRSSAVDIAYLSLNPDQISSLQKGAEAGNWQMISANGNTINYLLINVKSEPLNRIEVRQALAALINRSIINERVLQNQGEKLFSLIPTTFSDYKPTFYLKYGDGNIEKAKQLLTQAGYTPENPAIVELWYASNSSNKGFLGLTLKALADRDLGGLLKLQLNSVESTTAFKYLEEGIYPTFILDWYADFLDADNYIQPFLECSQGSVETGCVKGSSQYQGSFYYSDRMNQLIAQQRQEQNPETRKLIFQEIQELLAEDVPYIPLWQDKTYVFAQNGIDNIRLQLTQQLPFWTIKK